jgi:hypothetical protein
MIRASLIHDTAGRMIVHIVAGIRNKKKKAYRPGHGHNGGHSFLFICLEPFVLGQYEIKQSI